MQVVELPRIRIPFQASFITRAKFCDSAFLGAKALMRESLEKEPFAAAGPDFGDVTRLD